MFASAISTFSNRLQIFFVGTCRVINFLTFYFGQGFVEEMYCISQSNVAIPKSAECMCYSTFHRCMCIVYKLQPWLDCIFCEAQLLADFFKRIQLHGDLKIYICRTLSKRHSIFHLENQPPYPSRI